MYEIMKEYDIDARKAAYILALSRITEAMKVRGWID